MQPSEPNDEERQEQLPQDGPTPFSPAEPAHDPDADADDDRQVDGTIDDTHPITDDGIEPEEVYENDVAGATGTHEPNAGNTVVGYTPPVTNKDDNTNGDDKGQPNELPIS